MYRRAGIAVIGLLVPLVVGLTSSAAAAGTEVRPDVVTKTSTAEERAAARAYWTPDRMRAAAANDRSATNDRSVSVTPRSESTPATTLGPRALATPEHVQHTGNGVDNLTAPITHGRLFIYLSDHPPGKMPRPIDASCSASVVNSGGKNLIMTAAHCVYEHTSEGGTWLAGFVFVPMYWDGTAPFGIWDYDRVSVLSSWIDSRYWGHDYAILNMMDNNGQELADVVGANGLYVNLNPTQTVVIWGYPKPDRLRPHYCDQIRTSAAPGSRILGNCAAREGMSGGPWLVQYNYDIQLGYINGVTSTLPPGQVASPYFDDNMVALYQFAQS